MSRTAQALELVARGDLCSGCGLCAGMLGPGKIAMAKSAEGFLRPSQVGAITEAEDQLVADVCPGLRLTQEAREGDDHPLWGPIVQVRSGHSTDAALRHHASSGGALSAMLTYLLESKEVDYVVQTAADEREPIANVTVASVSAQGIYRAAGSRYSPSAPLDRLDSFLAREGRFAFVGKPCDVAALRAAARRDPRIRVKVPYMLSFFCAGIPSLAGARRILMELGVPEADVVRFRYRGDGWPGYATAVLKDGRQIQMDYATSWGAILSNYVQFRCKICPDGSGGLADVACADAWHCDDDGYPQFEEQDGTSLIVSRTNLGESLIRKSMEAGYLVAAPVDVAEIERMQPSQARRKRLVAARLAALQAGFQAAPKFRGFQLTRAARTAGLWQNVRAFLGMSRRLIFPNARRIRNFKRAWSAAGRPKPRP